MRLSCLATLLLLAVSACPRTLYAQSSPATPDSPSRWAVQPGTSVPADWALSIEAKMTRLAQETLRSNGGSHAIVRGCPIAFRAEREGNLGLRETRNPGPNPGPGLDLSFGAGQRHVVEADITVYGWSKQLRMVPAAYPAETSESFVLNGTNDQPLMQELVWMKRLGVVNTVELTRVVFSDGTTWAQAGDLHCTVSPSKLVLVEAAPLK